MRYRICNIFLILLMLAGLSAAQTAPAANDSATVVVAVWISSVTWVNVDPASFSYTGVTPGMETNPTLEAGNYFAIEIENIGSQNISKIWANATYDPARPWGTGVASNYDAGGFILLTANSTDSRLYFVNRIEYNESDQLVYLRDPAGNMPPSGYSYGRLRNASNEYFYMVQPAASGCNASTLMRIGNTPHNRVQTGTVDFTIPGDLTSVTLVTPAPPNNGYAVGNVTGGAYNGYCVAVRYDCGQVWLYHWNMDAPGAGNVCGNAKYLNTATSRSVGSLAPGGYFAANLTLRIPYGVAQGNVSGVLTILASDT